MRDKQREETRLRLYHAALVVFRRDGVHNCRIDDIAQLAEVSRAAFYFHFPTKDDVLLELMRESEAPVAKAINELGLDCSAETLLETTVTLMASFWKDDPRLIIDLATAALRHTAEVNDREAQPARAALTRHMAALCARGELIDVLPPEALADFFLSNCLAAMMAWSAQPGLPLEFILRGVVQLFLRGAQTSPAEKKALGAERPRRA